MAGVPRHDRGRPARVHLFPTPAALAAYCRTNTDHDLADHPVWPVVAGLGAADLTPDDDHRYDLDGVYDIAAENPDRWAVEELAATIDIVSRLAECLDTTPEPDEELDDAETEGQFEAVAELAAKPEIGSLGLGVDAFVGRSGEDAWVGVGGVLDDLWEDVVEELSEHLDWTGAGSVTSRTTRRRRRSRSSAPTSCPTSSSWTTTSRACARSPAAVASAPRPRRSRRPGSSGSPSASCRSRSWCPTAPGSRCAATSRTSPASSAATARCSSSTPPPTSPGSARATRTTTSWRSPPGPRSPTPTSPRCRPTRTATTSPSCPTSWARSPTEPPDWSTTGPSPSRSRASATSRSTPGSPGSRSCSRPRHRWAGRSPGREREPDATLPAEDAAELRRLWDEVVTAGQRSAGLPRLTGLSAPKSVAREAAGPGRSRDRPLRRSRALA